MAIPYSTLRSEIETYFNPSKLRIKNSLQDTIEFNSDIVVTTEDLRDFLVNGGVSTIQPLILFIDQALKAPADIVQPPAEGEPDSPKRLTWILNAMGLSELHREIEERLPKPDPITIVDQEFEHWYTEEREHSNTHYWDNYVRVLTRNGWDSESIGTVSNQAREVLRRIEDPNKEQATSTRGLAVGYVQSGKTANFTAVTAKAIDAGYRLIIILAGTLDNLRNQTQRRLDKELLGREAVLAGRSEDDMTIRERKDEAYFDNDAEWERDWDEKGGAFLEHGPAYGTDGFPRIKRLTTSIKDYQGSTAGVNPIDLEIPFKDKPVYDPDNLRNMPCLVAVVKKNSKVLEKLNSDLKRAAKVNGVIKHLPVLIIDDESDQASINTKNNKKKAADEDKDRTAVNAQVVDLLQNCPRAQYVGYTATPFANVFVDPSDPVDLYPRHYVLMLNQPPAYRGARWFHDRADFLDNPEDATIETSNSKAFIRPLAEETEMEPEDFQEERLLELQEALDMFVLTGAVKKYREAQDPKHSFKHHTMLVHEGVGNDSHFEAKTRLDEMWRKRGYNLGLPIPQLKRLFEEDVLRVMQASDYAEGAPIPATYEDLHPFIAKAYIEIMKDVETGKTPILQVDSQGKDSPNFEAGSVWKVLVGGAKLSRGYTVEGLTVSYFRRYAGGADTLMQTGRWFGFRKGYQDLVRLYAPDTLVSMFESAMYDEEVFRDNIRAYQELDDEEKPRLTPLQLAPLVRQSRPDLSPTAKNKMFNAYLKKTASAPNVVELNTIPINNKQGDLTFNFEHAAMPMLKALKPDPMQLAYFRLEGQRTGDAERLRSTAGLHTAYVGSIPGDQFIALLQTMRWYTGGGFVENVINPRLAYLNDLVGRGRRVNVAGSDFAEVGIILPYIARAQKNPENFTVNIPGIPFPVPLVDRSRRSDREAVTGGDRKYTYAIENIASGLPVTTLRPEDLALHKVRNKQKRQFEPSTDPEPFDLSPKVAKRRGAAMLTLFDDRPNQDPSFDIKALRAAGTYTAPSWENGEIGVALAFNSPHEAIRGQESVYEWSVIIPGTNGEDPIVVDADEVNGRFGPDDDKNDDDSTTETIGS